MSRDVVEVDFEHYLNVMTDTMDSEDNVKVVISAEVVPFDGDEGYITTYGEVQVTDIKVVDPKYPQLSIVESDITADEYDRIEDVAYRLVEVSAEYDGYYH
tara:strand:+ start:131 stop:433 length:303 start_codon:yes stop_codon:yes gene_type:complete